MERKIQLAALSSEYMRDTNNTSRLWYRNRDIKTKIMKYFSLIFLLLPLQAWGLPSIATKADTTPIRFGGIIQDVKITSQRPKYVRLKGYYRSYQSNDSVLKYYVDGIVEYYINLKNGKLDIKNFGSRHMRNDKIISKDRKRAFTLSDQATFRPWLEGTTYIEECKKKYEKKDSIGKIFLFKENKAFGFIKKDSLAKVCYIEADKLPTYNKLSHSLFGFNQEIVSDHFTEAYQLTSDDYYSFKNLLFQKTDQSYNYWYKKDSHKQLIHIITELYITEQEYQDRKSKETNSNLTPTEAAEVIEKFQVTHHIPKLAPNIQSEMMSLQYYDPSNLHKKIEK